MSSTFIAREEFRVNTTTALDQGAASIATLADGSFVVVWQSRQPADSNDGRFAYDNDLMAQRYDAAGHALDAETAIAHRARDQVQAQATATADGGYAVAYASMDDYDGLYKRFDLGVFSMNLDAQGHVVNSQSWSNGQLGNQYAPAVATLADGTVKVVYTSMGSPSAGLPPGVVGAPGGWIGGAQDGVVAALALGGYAMAWTAGDGLYSQAFGTATTEAVRVDAVGSHAVMAGTADGGYVLAWQSQGDILMQHRDASGVTVGNTLKVNSTTAGAQEAPAITVMRDGSWVVAWQSADGDGRGIFFQQYDASGAAVGTETRVNASATGDQFDAALSALHDGGFVAAWSAMEADGALDVHARIFGTAQLPNSIDLQGHEGMAYRLYQAAFDRMPDVPGLAYQTHALDIGLSLNLVASNFVASPEFASRYGTLDDQAFVTRLYANVLHRAPDEGGLQYHLDHLAHGFARGDVLAGFSESPENQALVVGSLGL